MRETLNTILSKYFHEDMLTSRIEQKVYVTFNQHVYNLAYIGQAASLFAACVVFIGLFSSTKSNYTLYVWFSIFVGVLLFRIVLTEIYHHRRFRERHTRLWRNLYILGSFLGGVAWGLAGFLLYPTATPAEQTLMILLLAGVTAGAVPLSSGIPEAAILFLTSLILPFIISIAMLNNRTFMLFDMALTVYLFYTIVLSIKSYVLIKNSILLKYENDALLINLTEAKSQLESSNIKLEQAATHDPLTQVANRRLFQSNLETAMMTAKMKKKLLGLLYVDLDHFKEMNDIYGHYAGDLILITIIERIRNYFGTNEIISRLGGDEITIILENINNKDEIEIIARDICRLIAVPVKMNDCELQVTASIGIGIYPDDCEDAGLLIRNSDNTMYEVKKSGGNSYRFCTQELARHHT